VDLWVRTRRGRASCLVPLLSLFGSIWGVAPLSGLGAKKERSFCHHGWLATVPSRCASLLATTKWTNLQNHFASVANWTVSTDNAAFFGFHGVGFDWVIQIVWPFVWSFLRSCRSQVALLSVFGRASHLVSSSSG